MSKPVPDRAAAKVRPAPVELRVRGLSALAPAVPGPALAWCEWALLVDAGTVHQGGAPVTVGMYRLDGPTPEQVGGWLLDLAAGGDFTPPAGSGPLLSQQEFFELRFNRLCARLPRASAVGFGLHRFFAGMAHSHRITERGIRFFLQTYEENGSTVVDTFRHAVDATVLSGGRILWRLAPRRAPDAEDLVAPPERWGEPARGRSVKELFEAGWAQWGGRFLDLADPVSALCGERVEDLYTACALFEVTRPPKGSATPETLPARIRSLAELYHAVLRELDEWPGPPHLAPDRVGTSASLVKAVLRAGGVPSPLWRKPSIPARALGAGMAAASHGARAELRIRRVTLPGLDLDGYSLYPVSGALSDVQGLLTHRVSAHHASASRSIDKLTVRVIHAVGGNRLLEEPEMWPQLAFLAKVRPNGDVFSVHVDLEGIEATVTTEIVEGSVELWVTGYDLACSFLSTGRVPSVTEAWWFETGEILPGLGTVELPGGWTWDPTGRRRGPQVRQNLFLLLAEMRMRANDDPELSPAQRLRIRGMLKVCAVSGVFGIFLETSPEGLARPFRLRTPDGPVKAINVPERPGEFCLPVAGAFVQGACRLLLALFLAEDPGVQR